MRRIVVAIAALGVIAIAHAQTSDADHSAHHPPADQEAAQPSAAPPTAAPERTQPGGGMKRIQDLMSQIQQTSDPAQRRELMNRHLLAMRDQVRAMRAAASQKMAMMGGERPRNDQAAPAEEAQSGHQHDEAQGKGDGRRKQMMMGGMMRMHQRMEQRLDTIEQMLEQLIEREVVESGAR